MKTITCLNGSALLAVTVLALSVAHWDSAQTSAGLADPVAGPGSPAYTAHLLTEWLPAERARRAIEERSALIERFARDNDIAVRVVDSGAQARTHTVHGLRLVVPQVQLSRAYEFRLEDARQLDLLRGTLASWSVSLDNNPPLLSAEAGPAGASF